MSFVQQEEVVKRDFSKALLRMFRRRVFKKNKNLNILVVGESGDAKSYISMKLAEALDPSFTMERVIFDNVKFVQIIDTLNKGNVIVLEELGVNAYNRNWYSYINKALDHVFQTFRHKNLITICNVPDRNMVDSHLREQFNVIIWATGVDGDRQLATSRIYLCKRNPLLGKTYYHKLPIVIDGICYKICRVNWSKPSKKLIDAYEVYMDSWKTELRNKFKNNVELLSGYNEHKSLSYEDIKATFLANPMPYCKWVQTNKIYKLEHKLLRAGFKLTKDQSKALQSKLLLEPEVIQALKPKPKVKEYYELANPSNPNVNEPVL